MAKETNAVIARAILSDLKSGKEIKDVTNSLAAYLVEERRIGDLKAIIRDVEKKLYESEGILYVHVTAARAIEPVLEQQITDIFKAQSSAKKIVLELTINPNVIGGVRCETADSSLDLTVRRQLQRLKTLV